MINNFERIRSLLNFKNNDDFYFVQIIKRRKDNPGLKTGSIAIKNFYIDSIEDFDKQLPRMIEICDKENARSYICLNKRNYRDLSLKMIKRTVDYMSNGNHKGLRTVFDTVAGEFHSEKDKTWIIDIDNTEESKNNSTYNLELSRFVCDLQLKTGREPLSEFIETKNGSHLITRPFNLMLFKEKYPNIDVHKDGSTLIYCP